MLEFFTLIINFIKQDFICLQAIDLNVSFSLWDLAIFLLFSELTVYIIASAWKGGEN